MTGIVAGDQIILVERVTGINIDKLESDHLATIYTKDGEFVSEGFHALEAIMLIKPSALEGRRLQWKRDAWAIHNLIGHPVMQLLAWCGRGDLGVRFHDYTSPTPTGFKT